MKCLLDLDGVLVDFVQGICDAHGVPNVYDNPEALGKYGMEDLLGMSTSQFWNPCNEDFWANLKPTKDGFDILALAENSFGAENICILTSPSANEGATTGKVRWIYKHLPQYKRRFLVGACKEFCAHEKSVLIDDYPVNVNKFREHGGKAAIVPRPWNDHHYIRDVVGFIGIQLHEIYEELRVNGII